VCGSGAQLEHADSPDRHDPPGAARNGVADDESERPLGHLDAGRRDDLVDRPPGFGRFLQHAPERRPQPVVSDRFTVEEVIRGVVGEVGDDVVDIPPVERLGKPFGKGHRRHPPRSRGQS
jgi:hypothetical protein